MAREINPELEAELHTANSVLDPQIRGMHDLEAVSISDDLKATIQVQITAREHRHALQDDVLAKISAAKDAMAALEADGYPALPQATIIASQYNELQEQQTDLETAIALFREQASRMTVGLGEPSAKPKPA